MLLSNLSLIQQVILLLAVTIIFFIGIYSLDLWFLTLISIFHARKNSPPPSISNWPKVTIQLPFYNESHVASRILDACINLDYPKNKLEIIVIDDSNDGTSKIVDKYRTQFNHLIKVIRRSTRKGYKAGALQDALEISSGEFISVFDADYTPSKDLLKIMIPYLYLKENVAFVQARWGYLDRDFSWYAKGIALAIDIYGVIDQLARFSMQLLPHFNGTAAIFRKNAIESVGGWKSDTLAEDLDLSIRLKLSGFTHIYLPWVVCPGEIPPTFQNLQTQQYRWARGFIECLKKYWLTILRSKRLPLFKKIDSLVYLHTYMIPLLSIIGIVTGLIYFAIFPTNFYLDNLTNSMLLGFHFLFSFISSSAPLVTIIATFSKYSGRMKEKILKLEGVVYLALVFSTLLLTYSKATIDGFIQKQGEFVRTPKIGGFRRR